MTPSLARPQLSLLPERISLPLLDEFYARQHLPVPEVERIAGVDMPEPYQQLLVHSQDMTPTLERYFGQRLILHAHQRSRQGHHYYREVTLALVNDNQPVEYGVIKIDLDLFPIPAREAILAEHYPLGRILQDHRLAHFSWPQAFFRIQGHPTLGERLESACNGSLYGRRNLLLNQARRLLAEVVEILPPMPNGCPS